LKVLVSAYACEPGKGSEPEVGWQWVHQIARFHETWVITRANNREAIGKALTKTPINNLHFVYYDLPDWARSWKRGNRGVHLYHQLWQYKILGIAQKLHKEHKFDICHHITFGVVWHPAFFYKLSDTKIIWGPFGGGEVAYRGCVKDFSMRGKITEFMRRIFSLYFFRLDPIVQNNFRNASLLLTRTDMTAKRIPKKYLLKTKVFLETGFSSIPIFERNRSSEKINIFTMSRLIPYKNIRVAILVMKLLTNKLSRVKLHIYGDGALEQDLKLLVENLNLKDNVIFHGNVSHDKMLNNIKIMDVLIHPAVRDGGTHSVMEAMAYGIPVICLDNAGPGYMVDDNSGIKINGKDNNEIITEIANAAFKLLTNNEFYETLSNGARNRVRDNFLWNQIGDRLNTLYQKVYHGEIGS